MQITIGEMLRGERGYHDHGRSQTPGGKACKIFPNNPRHLWIFSPLGSRPFPFSPQYFPRVGELATPLIMTDAEKLQETRSTKQYLKGKTGKA